MIDLGNWQKDPRIAARGFTQRRSAHVNRHHQLSVEWIDVQALVRVRRKPFARLSWTGGLALGFATLPDRLKRDLDAEVGALA